MRIKCDVCVCNRNLGTHSYHVQRKPIFAYLTLGKTGNDSKISFLLNTLNNKTGSVYKIDGNVEQVFKKYIEEGKATIRFSEPPHDILIQKADPIQLKSFLQSFKLAFGNDGNTSSFPKLMPPQNRKLKRPQRCLNITSKKQYIDIGSTFPCSLESLSINECNLSKFDVRISKLKFLHSLNLNHNKLKILPKDIGADYFPSLKDLRISHNELKEIPDHFFGLHMQKNLQCLEIQHNQLDSLPDSLCTLTSLICLKVDHNLIKNLPSRLGNLLNLKMLSASNNLLTCVPGSLIRLHLQCVDFSHNNFCLNVPVQADLKISVPSLLESSARSILTNKIRYEDEMLPRELHYYIKQAKWCVCLNPCFESSINVLHILDLHKICENVTSSVNSRSVPCMSEICSNRCLKLLR